MMSSVIFNVLWVQRSYLRKQLRKYCYDVNYNGVDYGKINYGGIDYGGVDYGSVDYGIVNYGIVNYGIINYQFDDCNYMWGSNYS